MKAFGQLVEDAISPGTVEQAAAKCGVPRHVLDDLLRERTAKPSQRYFWAIVRGLGIDEGAALRAAFAEAGEHELRPSNNGRRRGKATATTS